jgi:hypothetical protein
MLYVRFLLAVPFRCRPAAMAALPTFGSRDVVEEVRCLDGGRFAVYRG